MSAAVPFMQLGGNVRMQEFQAEIRYICIYTYLNLGKTDRVLLE